MVCNHKRAHRIYTNCKLNLRIKPKKRLAPRTQHKLIQPKNLNICWSLDYMTDTLQNGCRFRTANVLDDCNREAIGILVSRSLPSKRITCWLDQLVESRGQYPKMIRVDNGPENISRHFQEWASSNDVEVHYIQPGKPAQNAYIERFNRSYREAILDQYLFQSTSQVQHLTDNWLKHYNEERPHESLGGLAPWAYARKLNTDESSICEWG